MAERLCRERSGGGSDLEEPLGVIDATTADEAALGASLGGENPPAVDLLRVTGAYTEAEDVQRAKEAGFNAWVTKPISVSAVVKLVADVATARRQSVPWRDAGG